MASKKTKNPHDKHHLSLRTLREWMYGYIFIAPWLVGVSIFFIYAMVQSLRFSFNKIVFQNGITFQPLNYLWENYANVFTNEVNFPTTLGSFTMGLVLQLPIIIAFSLIIALLLNGNIKFRSGFRMIFFLPVIIATGPVMNQLTAQGVASVPMMSTASLANILGVLPDFLANALTELFNSLILILWNSGIQILIFLSGLQKVSKVMYEAAKIDGASGWESFWKITLPNVRSIILLNAVYTVVTLATGGTNAIIELIYNATYTATKGYSYGMAMSWIYTAIIAVILLVVFLLFKEKSDKHVKYEQKRVTLR